MIDPAAALIGLRALVFAAAAVLFGTFGLLGFNWTVLASALRAMLMPLIRAAAYTLMFATLAMLPVLAATAGDGWQDAIDPQTLLSVALSTRTGHAILVRIVLAAFILRTVRSWDWVTVGMLRRAAFPPALYIASFALTGHAVMHGGVLGIVHPINHAVHVLAGSFWIGALPSLLCAARVLATPSRRAEALQLLTNFSYAGSIAVALVALTGALNTALILGKLPQDMSSDYQRLLLIKIAFVAGMLGLALVNRLWLVPRANRQHDANALLTASIAFECAAGAAVIVLVAIFGTMEPV